MRRGLLSAALLLPSCFVNRAGSLSAQRTGELGPPAARRDARADLVAACGEGRLDAGVRRAPYLQRVSARGAHVLWTSPSRARARVVVTTPAGEAVGAFAAVDDPGAPGAGQRLARLEPLQPATTYCYEIREGERVVAGRAGFKTAPLAGSGAPVRFVAWGDSGSDSGDQHALLRHIPSVPFDFMLHTGDVAYPAGSLADLERTFFRVYAPLLRHFADFPVPGNHEYESARGAPFRQVFDLPGNERWYSFDWGDVHFVALDTEEIGLEQARWLDRDLGQNRLPWTVVFLHRPPFSSGEHGPHAATRRTIHPILEKHRVSLVLAGHEHNYERTRPIGGVTYVVTGGGGNGTRPVGRSAFTAFSEDVIHFVYVTIEGDRLRLHAIDAAGREFDGFTAVRNPRGSRTAAVGRAAAPPQ